MSTGLGEYSESIEMVVSLKGGLKVLLSYRVATSWIERVFGADGHLDWLDTDSGR